MCIQIQYLRAVFSTKKTEKIVKFKKTSEGMTMKKIIQSLYEKETECETADRRASAIFVRKLTLTWRPN